jgi:hypothetical protein
MESPVAPMGICSLEYLDPTQDILHVLMKHCPHIKDVDFDDPFEEARDVEYFFIALNNMNTWKIARISQPEHFTDLHQYHRLTCIMESSLEDLLVTKWWNDRDFTYLKRYTQLKSLG